MIDTYVIQSILAPSRLREMACTDALTPLNLNPAVTMAAHLHRSFGSNILVTSDYKPSVGTIFVGLDTGIKTGLPFLINAPLFLHEWLGDVLLENDDDQAFKNTFPGIRNVTIRVKNNQRLTKALALYVWNRQTLTSAMVELIPSILIEMRDPIQHSFSKNARLLYRYWPYYSRIRPRFKELIGRTVYDTLASPNMALYLTEKNGFKPINQGCFASPDFPLNETANFFLQHMSLFTIPKLVVEDLTHFNIQTRQLTPSDARIFLKGDKHTQYLASHPKDALAILEYCLADLLKETSFDVGTKAASICNNELIGLRLLPLADGSVGSFGKEIIIATAEQQMFLPHLRSKFLSSFATHKLHHFLSNPRFLHTCRLSQFGPKILSNYISALLPASWKGKDFVPWTPDNGDPSEPSKHWIYQFWREVSIWDHDQVQLFRRWPLIPTTTGELASCGNARFLLSVCPNLNDSNLRQSLVDTYASVKSTLQTNENVDVSAGVAQIPKPSDACDSEKDFWAMGEPDEDLSEHQENVEVENIPPNDEDLSLSSSIQEEEEDSSLNNERDLPAPAEVSPSLHPETNGEIEAQSLGYDPNSVSFIELRRILMKMKCPLLEASFYSQEELIKLLPSDRLGISRAIISTLRQCIDYWTFDAATSEEHHRLRWSELTSDDYESLILFLSVHQESRLSLMTSDLETMKKLPLFETFSSSHITIERGDNFTIDSSVDINSVGSYLPQSLKQKLLLEKQELKELYEDLNIECLNEATILQKFVLKEFSNMPLAQKEAVIQNLLNKWEILRVSDGLLENLRETSFVKRKPHEDSGEIVFVKPNQLYDPRNEFFNLMFDSDSSCFPIEEFATEESLEILKSVGLKTTVDKDTFLKCAYIVEEEQSVAKSIKLFEYFSENFSAFYDNNQDFTSKLAEVRCVPAELDGDSTDLYCFRDTTAPKDRHLTFKVKPIIHSSASPPQVMFSSLGIISPPSLTIVLKQLRALTEDEHILDHWTYQHGSVEKVFSCLFSFLQDNYSDLSPRVQVALRERPVVPVGTTLVKANRLFFRLAKDLAPFFYEVPRGFGANDSFLKNLGVRDSPRSEDYALSLNELNNEIGSSRLNANELKSVVEVVNLIATNDQSLSTENTCAPDLLGKLVSTNDLLQNDCNWLVQSGRLDMNLVHLAHPKMSKELCAKLQIGCLSEKIQEVLEDNFIVRELRNSSMQLKNIESLFKNDGFIDMLHHLIPRMSTKSTGVIDGLRVVPVECIMTRFVLMKNGRRGVVDVTNQAYCESQYCYIDKQKVLISQLPVGISVELAVATALCNAFKIDRKHLAGLSAVLSSPVSMATLEKEMGLFQDANHGELLRGEPGELLVPTDIELAEIKPLKMFSDGEIVAVHEFDDNSSSLMYGVVTASEQGSSLSRLRICIAGGETQEYLSSQVYSLVSGSSTAQRSSKKESNIGLTNLQSSHSATSGGDDCSNNIEESLVNVKGEAMAPVHKSEVLAAVQDLLHSANLSLNHDTHKMLDSNLTLQDELFRKDVYIKDLEEKSKDISTQLSIGIDSFLCPITREVMKEPVICADGHTYEKHSIQMWLQSHSRSPKTNQELPSTELIPNHALRNTIEAVMKCKCAIDLEEN